MSKKSVYERHACQDMNEAECEEDLDSDGLSVSEAEQEFYQDE
jgi:hypothetical protein